MRRYLKRLDALTVPVEQAHSSNWFDIQPCSYIGLGTKKVLITQPSSTFWVYLLGILTVYVGYLFLASHEGHYARIWWGIAMVLWGVGALLAGTSYQAFGYQIKCRGRHLCRWTSWWEVIYMIFQQLSMDALLVAVAYSSTEGVLREYVIYTAAAMAVVYTGLILWGAFAPIKPLLTFEFMVLYSLPGFVFCVFINLWNFQASNSWLEFMLAATWLQLILVSLAYYIYFKAGLTEKLWQRRIWFSENDILHVTLVGWMVFIGVFLVPLVVDLDGVG